jgi:hypothetical protein
MPFASSAGNFFGRFGPAQSNVPSGQSGIDSLIAGSKFKTGNLFDTIQAVRQNELDRNAKQAQIAQVLQELAMAPQKQALQQALQDAQIKKAMYDMDTNSVENQIRQGTLLNHMRQQQLAEAKLPLQEITDMSRGGFVQTSNNTPNRQELLRLGMTPDARMQRRDILKDRTEYGIPGAIKGPITGDRFVPKSSNASGVDLSNNPDLILSGYTSKGLPTYRSKAYGKFQRELITENPNLDLDTQKAIAAISYAEPRIKQIESLIDSGALGDDKTFKKFASAIVAKGDGDLKRYAVPDGSPLEELVSQINSLRIGGFGIAGTAYTDTEREIIEFGLNPIGKSLSQIKEDVRIVQDYMTEKARTGTMGLKEARSIVSNFKTLREKQASTASSSLPAGYSPDEWEVVSG